MQPLTASEARSNLYRLMYQSAESHQPILILGKRSNSVLIPADDWEAIQETLYLLSVPGMRESIKEGMEEPVDDCATLRHQEHGRPGFQDDGIQIGLKRP